MGVLKGSPKPCALVGNRTRVSTLEGLHSTTELQALSTDAGI